MFVYTEGWKTPVKISKEIWKVYTYIYIYIYTVSQRDTILLSTVLPNINRFSKFFHRQTQKLAIKKSLKIPPHLKRIATLPCEI